MIRKLAVLFAGLIASSFSPKASAAEFTCDGGYVLEIEGDTAFLNGQAVPYHYAGNKKAPKSLPWVHLRLQTGLPIVFVGNGRILSCH